VASPGVYASSQALLSFNVDGAGHMSTDALSQALLSQQQAVAGAFMYTLDTVVVDRTPRTSLEWFDRNIFEIVCRGPGPLWGRRLRLRVCVCVCVCVFEHRPMALTHFYSRLPTSLPGLASAQSVAMASASSGSHAQQPVPATPPRAPLTAPWSGPGAPLV
jgi:hypothetical protein